MTRIEVFQTHIEISPYEAGENVAVEKKFSKWDETRHRYIPVAFYVDNGILYLPRGTSITYLSTVFKVEPTVSYIYDRYDHFNSGRAINKPKSNIQADAIKFLLGEEKFEYSSRFSQLGLNLSTGDGKTYSAIYSIMTLGIKAIIFTHQTKIKDQWIKAFRDMTTIDQDTLIDISNSSVAMQVLSGDIVGNVYFMNYQTMMSLVRSHGYSIITDLFNKMRVGIKVYDESHKFFYAMLKIDFFTNTYKTYYLTATYGRSDRNEKRIYDYSFSNLVRFGEETVEYAEKRKHVNFIVCQFQSEPPLNVLPNLRTPKGFSVYKYIDYEMADENQTMVRAICNTLDKALEYEGKVLILSPKIESVHFIADALHKYYTEDIGIIHSKITEEEKAEAKEKRIISSTIKSLGTGVNISGLRCIINVEPVASNLGIAQTVGRLREYAPDKDTYFFNLIDTTVKETMDFQRRINKEVNKICKAVFKTKLNI